MNEVLIGLRRGWDVFVRALTPLLVGGFAWTLVNSIVGWLLIGPALVGLFTIAIRTWRGQEADVQANFAGFEDFGTSFVAGILFVLPFAAWSHFGSLAEAWVAQPPAAVGPAVAGEAGDAEPVGVGASGIDTIATPDPSGATDAQESDSTPPAEPADLPERPSVPLALGLGLLVHFGIFVFAFAAIADKRCGLGEAVKACLAMADRPRPPGSRLAGLSRQLLVTAPILLVGGVLAMLSLPIGFDLPVLLFGGLPIATCLLTAWYMPAVNPGQWAGLADEDGPVFEHERPSGDDA
jgi:hypothetical protein